MSHYFIDKNDPRIADLLRRLGNIGQSLGQLKSVARPMFKGDRFLTDEELSRLLKVSRRHFTGIPYRASYPLLHSTGKGPVPGIRNTGSS